MNDQLLPCLWREAARHVDAAELAAPLARVLSRHLPVAGLRIDEFSDAFKDVITLMEWDRRDGLRCAHRTLGVPEPEREQLRRWAMTREPAAREPRGAWPRALRFLDGIPTGIAGPLFADGHLLGLFTVQTDRALARDEATLFTAALEPLATALRNDIRLREMRRLQAAAEADRQTLLGRMGKERVDETVIGANQGLRHVMARVDQVAAADAGVLILGETGAGKEVIARAIHERSARRGSAFLRVNCGAIPPELIDSELFGHERGSFTGAVNARRGWFERADGGTLFLDEIGELAMPAQVRLLRVLQDGIVQRVGSEEELHVDVRVIAATHRDLPVMVQQGKFREDLWYRIAVFPIILPPLRERPQDIPDLAAHFVRRAANRLGLPAPPLGAADLERMTAYAWPGNVRELAAVLERAVILGEGRHLALDIALGPMSLDNGRVRHAERETAPAAFRPASLNDAIRTHILDALGHCNGKIEGRGGAAELLDINSSTLRARMRKLGIDCAGFRHQHPELRDRHRATGAQ